MLYYIYLLSICTAKNIFINSCGFWLQTIVWLYFIFMRNASSMKKKVSKCSLVLIEHELDRKNDIWWTFWNKVLEIFSSSKYSHIWFLVNKKWKQYLFHSSMSHRDHPAWLWHTEINEYFNRSDVKSLKIIPLNKKNLKYYSKRKLKKVIKLIKKIYKSIIWKKYGVKYDHFAVVSLDIFNTASISKYNCWTFVNSILRIDLLEKWINYSLPSTYDKGSIVDFVIVNKL